MAISGDYAMPVQVNGYMCRNCTDVAYAKKNIDPEHPKSGPFGINAASDPTRFDEAVRLGGALQGADPGASSARAVEPATKTTPGALLDVRA